MANRESESRDTSPTRRLLWAAFLIGFALSGFFDGIILHQLLQWHHLLSGVAPSDTLPDLRFQVVADGVFHVAHYLIGFAGLWLLWRARGDLARPGGDRGLLALALIGFGAWHIVDAVLVHWILQLHRIRMDASNLLLWDLIWFVPFGLATLAAGFWLLRREPGASGGGSGPGRRTAPIALALLVVAAGAGAAVPPERSDTALVVFRSGLGFADIHEAAEAAGGAVVWTDAAAGVWAIAFEPEGRPAALYRHGALLVSSGPFAAGCLSWSRV